MQLLPVRFAFPSLKATHAHRMLCAQLQVDWEVDRRTLYSCSRARGKLTLDPPASTTAPTAPPAQDGGDAGDEEGDEEDEESDDVRVSLGK